MPLVFLCSSCARSCRTGERCCAARCKEPGSVAHKELLCCASPSGLPSAPPFPLCVHRAGCEGHVAGLGYQPCSGHTPRGFGRLTLLSVRCYECWFLFLAVLRGAAGAPHHLPLSLSAIASSRRCLKLFFPRNLMDKGNRVGGEGRGKKEEKHTFMFTCRNRPFCLSALFCV